ncbi:putative disease resistance RPP13-like protein 1 [Mangifera indica]|uniref:putative disease resistance RPP13-like protein 1 n=1 Tax=Mangifera indica TaxID=29780 RepID=UPI001CFAF680|nr:putative disease resistance RPP13-like protein 1 [Mangifera indica]
MIQAVLQDAEQKQLPGNAVKVWLEDLRDLAFDVDDILDEIGTEASDRKLAEEHHTSFCNGFGRFSPSSIKFNVDMKSKIKDITTRLEELCKLRVELGLESVVGGSSISERQRPCSTCLPTEAVVYGRDEDKAKVLELVLMVEPNDDASFHVIPIVGMAGVGKTTLAQLVFNDKKAVEYFDMRAWVCVSDDFDVFRITRAILESVTSLSCDLKDLNQVQVKLKEVVTGRKFLFVLDDVWSEDNDMWETLKSPFTVGAEGSKIMVTTRSEHVALIAGHTEYYTLKLLSDDDCWSMFMKHAFGSRVIDSPRMEIIRQRVVEKCRGLPLAARTLGGLLRMKLRYEEWDEILNGKIWNVGEGQILSELKLSYNHLPSHLKRCFAYCAILPKGYEFEKEELVHLWMAEGLIQESGSNNHMQIEDLGFEYFHDLLSRSLFQQSSTNSSKYVMHDLINDLAQMISGEVNFRLENEAGFIDQLKRFKRARHCSYISGHLCDGKNMFQVFHQLEHLRTFLPILTHDNAHYITNMVLDKLLPKLRRLRVLSLENYHITVLPDSIGDLRHLRFLNLSGTMIRSLPKSACLLLNLQILLLRDCFLLKKLPSKMRKLINLRHLDISGVKLIQEMPLGIKKLTFLQVLSNFIIGKSRGSSLEDLRHLKLLRQRLCISGLENVTDIQGTGEAILSDKKHLRKLVLEWRSQFDDSQNEMVEERVLDMLRPHENLKELCIKSYSGCIYPTWVGDSSFSNMMVLKLENCENCTSLPVLGPLSSLKNLTIKRMTRLKSIGSEFYGKGCSKPFESLTSLCLEDLQELEYWESIIEDEQVEIFPSLQKLWVVKCPKLSGRLPDNLPLLDELIIQECRLLEVSISSFPILSQLEINGCKSFAFSGPISFKSLHSLFLTNISEFGNLSRLQRFQKVECLKIVNCQQLISLWLNCNTPNSEQI